MFEFTDVYRSEEPQRLNSALIIDADDTLWPCQEFHDVAKAKFASLVAGELNISEEYIIQKFTLIRLYKIPKYWFGPSQFTASLVEAYESLCLERNCVIKNDMQAAVIDIGNTVRQPIPQFYEGVEDSLIKLSKRGYFLVLLTAGPKQYQELKIIESGAGELVDAYEIVNAKSEDTFSNVMNKYYIDPKTSFSIGNSAKSDILPSLKAGLSAIWIRKGNWAYENNFETLELEKFKDNYKTVRDFPDVLQHIPHRIRIKLQY